MGRVREAVPRERAIGGLGPRLGPTSVGAKKSASKISHNNEGWHRFTSSVRRQKRGWRRLIRGEQHSETDAKRATTPCETRCPYLFSALQRRPQP